MRDAACASARPQPLSVRGDCRCLCGSLLARIVPGGVELRCRRCKRQVVIPWEDSEDSIDRGGLR